MWQLKERNIAPVIKWEILNKVDGNPKQNMCSSWLIEKFLKIIFSYDNYLNK